MKLKKDEARFLKHSCIAHITAMLVVLVLLYVGPYHMKVYEIVVFSIIVILFLRDGLKNNGRFSGYGVAKEINGLAGDRPIIGDFGGLVWGGLAVRFLRKQWHLRASMDVGLLGVASILFLLAPSGSDGYFAKTFPRLCVTFAAAATTARLAEIYVWLLAQRQLLWYLEEKILRGKLGSLTFSREKVEIIVQQAREQGLLQ